MSERAFRRSQWVPRPVSEVFPFFARPENLAVLMTREQAEGVAFLKSGIATRNSRFNGLIDENLHSVLRKGGMRAEARPETQAPKQFRVASVYGLVDRGSFIYFQAGYDPEWRNKSVGLVLVGETFKDAIEGGLTEYDFLRGTETYGAWISPGSILTKPRRRRKTPEDGRGARMVSGTHTFRSASLTLRFSGIRLTNTHKKKRKTIVFLCCFPVLHFRSGCWSASPRTRTR